MDALYCCPRKDGLPGCEGEGRRSRTSRSGRGKKPPGRFAFATLLMLGDGYLPGALLVGMQLSTIAPEIDRVCMVTPDVSPRARSALNLVFTTVLDVPYISVDPTYVKKNEKLAFVYSHTFTKLNVLKIPGGYDKIAYIDADMIPLRNVAALFNAETPAGVFVGCFRPWHDAASLRAYKASIACRLDGPSKALPPGFSRRAGCTRPEVDIGVETSVMVVRPDAAEFERLVSMVREIERSRPMADKMRLLKGDTTLLSSAWDGRWHPLDIRYLARWVGESHDEVWIADSYGNDGKPWQNGAKAEYPDTALWLKTFAIALNKRPDIRKLLSSGGGGLCRAPPPKQKLDQNGGSAPRPPHMINESAIG